VLVVDALLVVAALEIAAGIVVFTLLVLEHV
jgi:hypothetical protein